jgi:serine/threonine protein phosphatase PrpC
VTNVLTNQELLSILGDPDLEPHLLVNRLLHEVNARGGPDNATAVLVQIR